jgi:hypothetical protein
MSSARRSRDFFFEIWCLELADEPKASEVVGANFSVVGFPGSAVNGKLYSGESADGAESTIFEIDPVTNTAAPKFTMEGYFAGLSPLE